MVQNVIINWATEHLSVPFGAPQDLIKLSNTLVIMESTNKAFCFMFLLLKYFCGYYRQSTKNFHSNFCYYEVNSNGKFPDYGTYIRTYIHTYICTYIHSLHAYLVTTYVCVIMCVNL